MFPSSYWGESYFGPSYWGGGSLWLPVSKDDQVWGARDRAAETWARTEPGTTEWGKA